MVKAVGTSNVQVKIPTELYENLKIIAEQDGIRFGELLRRGMALYCVVREFDVQGKYLASVDQKTDKIDAKLYLLGGTSDRALVRARGGEEESV